MPAPGPPLGRLAPRRCRLALTPGRPPQNGGLRAGDGLARGRSVSGRPGGPEPLRPICGTGAYGTTRHRIYVRDYLALQGPSVQGIGRLSTSRGASLMKVGTGGADPTLRILL